MALSLLLLASAALFLRSLDNLRRVNPGFDTENLVGFSIDPSMNGYDLARQDMFYDQLRRELEAIPNVSAVTLAAEPLMADALSQSTVKVEGYRPGEDEDMNPFVNEVGPAFFQIMGIPLLAGRSFTGADHRQAPRVAIVSESFARKYFADGSAIGRKLAFSSGPEMTIIGIVKEPKQLGVRDAETARQVYVHSAQSRRVGGRTFYLRTPLGLEAIAPSIREKVKGMDATLPVDDIRTMRQQIEISLTMERLVSTLCAAFGLIATLMAAVGLYGVMAFHVSRRTREIGIRIALGARNADVLGMVLREAVLLAGLGVAVGVPASVALGRYVRGILFGIQPDDAVVYAGSAALLIGTAIAASLLPARRAARVDPMRSLRYE